MNKFALRRLRGEEIKKNNKSYIYEIICDGHVIYLGQSKKPKKRFYTHIYAINNNKKNINKSLYNLLKLQEPEFLIIDKCNDENIKDLETKHILKHLDNGNLLLNKIFTIDGIDYSCIEYFKTKKYVPYRRNIKKDLNS
jgi:hypothetical protein